MASRVMCIHVTTIHTASRVQLYVFWLYTRLAVCIDGMYDTASRVQLIRVLAIRIPSIHTVSHVYRRNAYTYAHG